MRVVRFLISDASRKVEVETHVLRYWEEELGLLIPRNELGHRYYREEDIKLFLSIKKLKEEGFQLKAIRMLLPELNKIANLERDRLNALRDKLDILLGINKDNDEPSEDSYRFDDITENESLEESVDTEVAATVESDLEKDMMDFLNESIKEADETISDEYYTSKDKKESIRDGRKVIDMTNVISVEQDGLVEENGEDNTRERKIYEFKAIMNSIMSDAVKSNNNELVKEFNQVISGTVRKEVEYLLHLKEEREEERYKKLDRTIREYQISRQQTAAVLEVEKKKKKSKFFKKNKVHI